MDNIDIILEAVIKNLNTISVNGKDNMKKIIACISVLEKIISKNTDDIYITNNKNGSNTNEPQEDQQ